MENYKIIIAGGRDFNDYELLYDKSIQLIQQLPKLNVDKIEIVSGTANGADKLGEKFAYDCGFHLKQFPANWNLHGKSAGFIRNKQMADYADMLIAFWDGKSRGTSHMISTAKNKFLRVEVINYG